MFVLPLAQQVRSILVGLELLYIYLFAKKHNGVFILRIEDTDQSRYVDNAEEYIINSLEWCGIPFDEGPGKNEKVGPYRQSERKKLYKEYVDILIEKERAYYAFDTSEELNAHRKQHEAVGKTFIYNWHNRQKGRLKNSLVLTKEETRMVARRHNLNVAEKPDSQDICFVPEGKYADVVRKLRPGNIECGNIIDVEGKVLGQHNGIIDYTIGQRKGLGIGGRKGIEDDNSALYVIGLDSKKHNVTVGPKELLACNKINISECNWIIDNPKKTKFNVLVKLRNSSTPVRGVVDVNIYNGTSELNFDEPQYGISTGQAAVFYNIEEHSHVLGGGWIVDAPNMFSQL